MQHGIKVTSYACDGTSVERSVLRLLFDKSTRKVTHKIKHPVNDEPDIEIIVPFYGQNNGIPIATIQDSKHGLKMFRNNLFAGARCLTLGNYACMYADARDIAFSDGPLYHRDVEKLDRQDDSAATRLFSGDTLQWIIKNRPEKLGLVVYLFVFGELIDAYQNRSISIEERVEMVMRTHFFMETWEDFLSSAKYPKSKHFISHEAADITRILINGFMQLVYIYRDHTPGKKYPLFPWLLSSEICEHIFGLCRQLEKDFDMAEIKEMLPKIFLQLREAIMAASLSNGKNRASGYNHTYMDQRGINLAALSTYPINSSIDSATHRGFQQSGNLWAILGVVAADLKQERLQASQASVAGCSPIKE